MRRYRSEDFVKDAIMVLDALGKELENRKKGVAGDGTVEELRTTIDELEGMLDLVKNDRLPEKRERQVRFAWTVLHNWDFMNSELAKSLLLLADKYERKLPAGVQGSDMA